LHDLGIRLITPERPGTGKSTMKNNYSFKDIADDNSTLLRYLGIAKVSCIAFANGAPYAASFAYHYPVLRDNYGVRSATINLSGLNWLYIGLRSDGGFSCRAVGLTTHRGHCI